MTLTHVIVLNAILATGVVAALAYVCLIPYRLDRIARPDQKRAWGTEPETAGYERAAA
jgi:hypothetical protein